MFARTGVLSLVLPLFASCVVGLDLDVNSQDSIKSAAKTLAGGIIAKYDADLQAFGPPGLFEDYYFWQDGTVLNTLIGYSYLTGDSQYDAKISEALLWQASEFNNFMPFNQTKVIGNDDQSCWGLAAMTAAEVGLQKPKDKEWVDYAVNVWENQAARLAVEKNSTCNGGLRWQIFAFNAGYDYKNTWSNGNFFLLSARLAKFTGNATYSQYADKSFKWAQDVELVSNNFAVYDGVTEEPGCENVNKIRWTSTHGIYTEGAALMYNMTGAQNWTAAVNGLVNASADFQESASSAVLVEKACETRDMCNVDHAAYKGVFARTLARAAIAAPIVKDSINKILSTSAQAASKHCEATGETVECPLEWTDAETSALKYTALDGNLGEVNNALEVIQGLLYPNAKALKVKASSSSAGGSATQSGNSSGTVASAPQNTGAAGTITASFATVLLVAFAAAFSC